MIDNLLARISRGRRTRKASPGEGVYQKPHNPYSIRESRLRGLFPPRLGGRQPAYNAVASKANTLTHHGSSPTVTVSRNRILEDSESPSEGAGGYQIDSRVEASLPNMDDPGIILSPSMSGLSPTDTKGLEQTLLSNRNSLQHYSNESKGIHSPSYSSGPRGSNFPAVEESWSLECGTNTTPALPPNGISPEKDNPSESNPDIPLKSVTSSSLEPISNSSSTGQVIEPSDMALDTQTSERTWVVLDRPGSVLETPAQQTSLEGVLEQPQASLGSQDHQPTPAAISNRQWSIFDLPGRQESVLATQGHAEFSPDRSNQSEPTMGEKDYREPNSHAIENQRSNLITLNLPESIQDTLGYSESVLEERVHLGLEEKNHATRPQSRSESIKSRRSNKGKSRQALSHSEAKLHRLRWRSLKTRALISEKRTRLHWLRNEMSDSDAEFVKLGRERWINGSLDDLALKASFEKLQASRDAFGPLEEEYNRLEERLDGEEFELAELEEKMLKIGASVSKSLDSDSESQSSGSVESGFDNLEAMKEQQNPLYKEFMSRLGDSGLHREAYSYLLFEHNSLLEAEEVSQRYGREFPIGDQIALAKFSAREQKMLEEQREIDTDVERLRLECIRIGLLPEEEDEETDILQTSDESVDPEYNKFSRLLDQPSTGEDEKSSKNLLSEFKSGDTGDRITRWLLHKLRSSCLEVELLARFTDGLDRPVDIQKWQEEVLYFWFIDSAILPPSAYHRDPTDTAVPSSNPTDPNMVEHKLFGEKHFIELIVRSSSLSNSLQFGMLLKIARMKGRSAVTS